MHDDRKNINDSGFDELFRQKMENHVLPVDESAWEAIENALDKKKRRIIPFWWWFSGGAAVAGLALLLLMRPFDTTQVGTYTQQKAPATISGEKAPEKSSQKTQTEPEKSGQNKEVAVTGVKKTVTVSVTQEAWHLSGTDAKITLSSKETEKTLPSDTTKTSPAVEQSPVTAQNHPSVDTIRSLKEKEELPDWQDKVAVKKQKKESGWLLAAAFGTGSSVPSGMSGYQTSLIDVSLVNAEPAYTSIMTPGDFSSVIYSPPVSFGISVQKPIARSLRLESGLTYTYLFTKFSNSGVQQRDAFLHLHYIGVPLNVVLEMIKNTRWEFYFSGGGMVEKGIRSLYIQNLYYGNQVVTTTVSEGIKGLQWSVSAAMGATWQLQPNIGLYIEPKVSYYFDNNQPVSARTDQPVTIGLTAGLRFTIK